MFARSCSTHTLLRAVLAGSIALTAACSDAAAPSLAGSQLALAVATRPAGSAAPVASRASLSLGSFNSPTETIILGQDTIVVTQAQLVLRQIELERVTAASDCAATTNVNDTTVNDSHGHDGMADNCEVAVSAPILVDLPLGAGAVRAFAVTLDTGTYKRLQVEVHAPESGDATDNAFIAANPAFQHASIRVTGTYNHVAFTYTSALDVEQETDLVPPLAVTATTPLPLTLMVNLDGWFANGARTGLVDPATALAGQPNQSLVEGNIKTSFHAFEDSNEDGHDDHS